MNGWSQTKAGGCGCILRLVTIIPVAAAASVPSSFTSINAFCTKFDAYRPLLPEKPDKSALPELNKSLTPSRFNVDTNFNSCDHYVELADGSRSNNIVQKKGDVEIYLKDSCGDIHKVLLKNVLYIPSFSKNIFSVQAATMNGACVKFDSH